MKWITRSRVHIDRVACPWLIKRFIDSEAHFVFVAKSQIARVVKETGAIPFDCPDAELGHHNGKCSFETFLEKYQLTDPGLRRMAKIVHAADIDKDIGTDDIATGFEAIATGFSLLFPDDQVNIEKQFLTYDALYTWCKFQEK